MDNEVEGKKSDDRVLLEVTNNKLEAGTGSVSGNDNDDAKQRTRGNISEG